MNDYNIISRTLIIVTLSGPTLDASSQGNISEIGFGSCGDKESSLKIFEIVVSHEPDSFSSVIIFTGTPKT